MADQPRDIHGTPIYVGDRVAIAAERPDSGEAVLIVRSVLDVDCLTIGVSTVDGYDSHYPRFLTRLRFLRLS